MNSILSVHSSGLSEIRGGGHRRELRILGKSISDSKVQGPENLLPIRYLLEHVLFPAVEMAVI